jgi:adenine specific DNA methylase Mod
VRGLKLIYIDPPFDVGADFSMDIEIGGDTFTKKPNILEEIAYRDTWGKGADSFIAMIYERFVLMRDLLAEDGSIYVHCDWRVNSYIRLVLDEVFGKEYFRNEITWKRQPPRGARAIARQYGRSSDNLLFFSKHEPYIWNPQFKEYSGDYIKSKFTNEDADGRRFRVGDIGDYSEKSIADFRKQGKIYDYSSGKIGLKRYLDEQKELPTPPKNPKPCSNASSKPAVTKATWWPTSSPVPAPPLPSPKNWAASGSSVIWGNSPFTPPASA